MRREVCLVYLVFLICFVSKTAGAQTLNGPLRVDRSNPLYFTEDSGRAIYLTGSHNWYNLQDGGPVGSPLRTFDYTSYVNLMQLLHQNFMRLWMYEGYENVHPAPYYFEPLPWKRSTTPGSLDGGDKFDLTKFNQTYFDRLRCRVIDAGNHGIYVSVMLFQGWSIGKNAWPGHPFNFRNNINGINGDLSGNGTGYGTHSLQSSQIVALQESYVKKVIDTVNDQDNVLYEISNEEPSRDSIDWQYHMIDFIHNYEKTKLKQHPVGMTAVRHGKSNDYLYAGNAEWISPATIGSKDYEINPPVADGRKVVLLDSDHLNPSHTRNATWVWKSFLRGYNPLLMDNLSTTETGEVAARNASGYTAIYARKMNIGTMVPSSRSSDCSTTYCLRNAGREYLIYQPASGSFTVKLIAGDYYYEWFNPVSGTIAEAGNLTTETGNRSFTPPFSGDAVFYLKNNKISSEH